MDQSERKKVIDQILGKMSYGTPYNFNDLFTSVVNADKFIELGPDGYTVAHRLVHDEMVSEGLITSHAREKAGQPYQRVTLTMDGQKAKEATVMTDTGIVLAILNEIPPERHFRFHDVWSKTSKADLRTIRWRFGADRIYKMMIDADLIRLIRMDGDEAIIELGDRGYNVREGTATFTAPVLSPKPPPKLAAKPPTVRPRPWYLYYGKRVFRWTVAAIATIIFTVIGMIAYDWRPEWTKPAPPTKDQTTPQKGTIQERPGPLEAQPKTDSIPHTDSAKTK